MHPGHDERDPRNNPAAGDIVSKWGLKFTVDQVTQGCVFTTPRLSNSDKWVGILHWRKWATDAAVIEIGKPAKESA